MYGGVAGYMGHASVIYPDVDVERVKINSLHQKNLHMNCDFWVVMMEQWSKRVRDIIR
jgi:hypothetical protein